MAQQLAYTIDEVCALSKIGRTTIYAAISDGSLATSKMDSCYTNAARLLVRTLDQRPSVDSLKLALSNPI